METAKKRPSCDTDLGRFADRLHQLLDKQSARSFAIKAGLSVQSFHKYISGISEPTRPVMNSIAEAAGVNLEWLSTGTGPMRKSDILSIEAGTVGMLTKTEPQPFTITNLDGRQVEYKPAPGLSHIPVLTIEAACGLGALIEGEEISAVFSATEA
jgi:hypothetical protein